MKTNSNVVSRQIFDNLNIGKISRLEFIRRYNELFERLTQKEKDGALKRMETMNRKWDRTLGQYALCIYDNTRRERALVTCWSDITGCLWRDNGTDNSGLLLFGHLVNGKADYIIEYEEIEERVEIKFSPYMHKYTIKKQHADSYIRQGATQLVFFTDGQMIGPNGNPNLPNEFTVDSSVLWYGWMTPDVMREILDTFPICPYKEMGGADGVQLGRRDILKHFALRRLQDESMY